MGVYIPDIETPNGHNYVTITIWSSGIASYGLFDREENLSDFKSIKAVPVPPHGDLIDRDDVCYQLEKQATIDGQPRAIRRARRIVADAPTIIPEDGKDTDVPTRKEEV